VLPVDSRSPGSTPSTRHHAIGQHGCCRADQPQPTHLARGRDSHNAPRGESSSMLSEIKFRADLEQSKIRWARCAESPLRRRANPNARVSSKRERQRRSAIKQSTRARRRHTALLRRAVLVSLRRVARSVQFRLKNPTNPWGRWSGKVEGAPSLGYVGGVCRRAFNILSGVKGQTLNLLISCLVSRGVGH